MNVHFPPAKIVHYCFRPFIVNAFSWAAISNAFGFTVQAHDMMARRVLRLILAGLTAIPSTAAHAEATGEVRYVWVSKLILRAEPDGKSAELARLPFGTKVVLSMEAVKATRHHEAVAKLRTSSMYPAADITLDGSWHKAQALDKEGWVFDGYLSRYPAPREQKGSALYDDSEIAYAAQVFDVAHFWQWKKGDGRKSESYKIMRRKWKLDENSEAAEVSWSRVEFKLGGSAEMSNIVGDGSNSTLAFENLPLSFNEAVLWWRHFHPFDGSGTFEPGRKVDVGPPDDDSSMGYDRVIECDGQTCNIRRDASD